MTKRFAFVLSTAGSVMRQALCCEFMRERTHAVIGDGECTGLVASQSFGIDSRTIDKQDPDEFCLDLAEMLEPLRIDYIVSFYTRFYSKAFRDLYRDRIINFHPSLLPAFKGMDGFGDGLGYHTKIIGTTVELIRDVMDEGKIVMQTACAVDPGLSRGEQRHRIFVQQCRSLLQVAKWLDEERVEVDGDRVAIAGARYADPEFVPALEFADAIRLQVPIPEKLGASRAGAPERNRA